MEAKKQAAQTAFGSTYGKHKSQADAQIGREIQRLQDQMALRGENVNLSRSWLPRSAEDQPTKPKG